MEKVRNELLELADQFEDAMFSLTVLFGSEKPELPETRVKLARGARYVATHSSLPNVERMAARWKALIPALWKVRDAKVLEVL